MFSYNWNPSEDVYEVRYNDDVLFTCHNRRSAEWLTDIFNDNPELHTVLNTFPPGGAAGEASIWIHSNRVLKEKGLVKD